MNIYIIGLTCPPLLSKMLATHGFTVHSRGPSSKDSDAFLAWISIKNKQDITVLSHLRKRLPNAWLVAVVPKSWLGIETHVSLLTQSAKDDVATHEEWLTRFWFVLQIALNHRKRITEIARLTKDGQALARQIHGISDRASCLVTQLEKNLELAESIQRSLLPKFTPEIAGVNLCVKYLPAAGAGGDYYDVFEFGDKRRFGFLLADSKTHGIAALLLSILLKVRLEEMKERFRETRTFVDFINRELVQNHRKEMATLNLLYGILDRHSLAFEFTVAGNLNPFLVRHGKGETMAGSHPPLGSVDHYAYRESRLTLKPGDLLILHTDGLTEPLRSHRGISGVIEKLSEFSTTDPLRVQNEILGHLHSFAETRAVSDDITLVQIQVLENTLYLASHSK